MKLKKIKIFKHKADYLPVGYSIVMIILQIAAFLCLPFFWICITIPIFLILLFPLAVYNHHQQHHNIFKQTWLNRLFEMQLSYQSGVGPYGWVLHHNLGHHLLYMNHRPDENYDPSTWKDANGLQLGIIKYCIDNLLRSINEVIRIGSKYPNIFKKWFFYSSTNHFIILALLIYKPIPALLMFYVIPILMIVITYAETYFHHAGLGKKNSFESCYNYFGKFYNYVTFNLGYHTAHHMNPSLHWSKLPEYHKTIQDQIPEHCTMNSRIKFLKK